MFYCNFCVWKFLPLLDHHQLDSAKVLQVTGSEDEKCEEIDVVDETTYSFTPDALPSQRQVFYQLCDIHDDTLQAIIHSSDGKEDKCDVSSLGG